MNAFVSVILFYFNLKIKENGERWIFRGFNVVDSIKYKSFRKVYVCLKCINYFIVVYALCQKIN